MVGAGAECEHEQGRPGDGRNGDRHQRGAAGWESGLWSRWVSEEVKRAGHPGDDPGSDTERGVAHVERIEQRVRHRREHACRDCPDRTARQGQLDGVSLRPAGPRDGEGGPGRVERQHQRDRP